MALRSASLLMHRATMSSSVAENRARLPCLLACNMYVSEGRDRSKINAILDSARTVRSAAVVHVFQDEPYNRSGMTVVGESEPLQTAMLALASAALAAIDLREQTGSHPRIGAVDHISVHPLQSATLMDAAAAVKSVGREIGSTAQVPVYLYGAARLDKRPLDEIRRALGYFRGAKQGEWRGFKHLPTTTSPDYGPPVLPAKSGCIAMGAIPWVVNYNIVTSTEDLAVGKRIARAVSERGGGLPGVQAMALIHSSRKVEVACNILNHDDIPSDMVSFKVEGLCRQEGVTLVHGYFPGLTPQIALEKWRQLGQEERRH